MILVTFFQENQTLEAVDSQPVIYWPNLLGWRDQKQMKQNVKKKFLLLYNNVKINWHKAIIKASVS